MRGPVWTFRWCLLQTPCSSTRPGSASGFTLSRTCRTRNTHPANKTRNTHTHPANRTRNTHTHPASRTRTRDTHIWTSQGVLNCNVCVRYTVWIFCVCVRVCVCLTCLCLCVRCVVENGRVSAVCWVYPIHGIPEAPPKPSQPGTLEQIYQLSLLY